MLAKMVEDDETRNKIDAQARDYELFRGTALSNKIPIQNLDSVSPSVHGSMPYFSSTIKFQIQ